MKTIKRNSVFPLKNQIIFIAIIFFSIILSVSVCIQADCAKKLLDLALSVKDCNDAVKEIIFITGVLLIAEFLRKLLTTEYERITCNTLQEKMIKGILSLNFKEYEKKNHEEYVSLFNNEIRSIVSDYYITMLDFIYSILCILFYGGFLFKLQPIIAIVVVVSNIFPVIIPVFFANSLEKKKASHLTAIQKYNIRIGDAVKGFCILKLHNRKDIYENICAMAGKKVTKAKSNFQNMNSICEIVIGFFAYASYLCIVVGGIWLIYYGKLTPGELLAAITISEALVIPIVNFTYQVNTINAIRQVKREVFELYINRNSNEFMNQSLLEMRASISKIEIKNLSFSYEDRKILNGLNLTIEKNKKYLICGENGSGKSTLLKILTKQSDYEGSILVNGVELRDIAAEVYFEAIGFAMQKSFVFNDTIANNITLFKKGNYDSLETILNYCQAQNLLTKVGINTEYHDGRANMSGGEIQKLSLARLIFDNKTFQIWDEAMSAFDKKSSRVLEYNTLNNPEITLINIQHTINEDLLPMYDAIFELSEGKLKQKIINNK